MDMDTVHEPCARRGRRKKTRAKDPRPSRRVDLASVQVSAEPRPGDQRRRPPGSPSKAHGAPPCAHASNGARGLPTASLPEGERAAGAPPVVRALSSLSSSELGARSSARPSVSVPNLQAPQPRPSPGAGRWKGAAAAARNGLSAQGR